jgi:hypothetical protein
VLTAALYVLFAILALVAPRLFQIVFDAQFFGANVASLFPKVQPSAASLVTLVLMIVMSWVVGYAWACLYNRFAKSLGAAGDASWALPCRPPAGLPAPAGARYGSGGGRGARAEVTGGGTRGPRNVPSTS